MYISKKRNQIPEETDSSPRNLKKDLIKLLHLSSKGIVGVEVIYDSIFLYNAQQDMAKMDDSMSDNHFNQGATKYSGGD